MSELKSLGRYQIKGVLGKGAMGLVYDGLDPTLDRRVAIKTILTRNLDEATAKHYEMRFKREVRAVARINHANIVQVYDFGTEGDLAYIVMEYVEGKELKDRLDSGQGFDLNTIFAVMGQLLDGLHFAHEAGVIHRDIKPANVMLDTQGHAKLADFGVARITEGDDQLEKTRAGALIGTPSYMSPEQIQGQTIDRRTDIFSAGVLFYHMLTGKKPFEGTGFALAAKIIQEEPAWPSTVVQIPPDIDRVVARALAKEADKRFPTALAFAEALQRIAKGKPPEAPGEAPYQLPRTGGPAARPQGPSEAEKELWDAVKESDDPDEVALYLEQFPQGGFVQQARARVEELKARKSK